MERLTRKHDENTYAVKMQECETEQQAKKMLMENFKKCCKKLGKLEDLEEQIGMPLDLFVQVLWKQPDICAIKECGGVFSLNHYGINGFKDGAFYHIEKGFVRGIKSNIVTFFPKDFGVSWFLNFEEAEKVLEERKNETNRD